MDTALSTARAWHRHRVPHIALKQVTKDSPSTADMICLSHLSPSTLGSSSPLSLSLLQHPPILSSDLLKPHITPQEKTRSEQKVQTRGRRLTIAESDGMRTIDQLAETQILLLFIPH